MSRRVGIFLATFNGARFLDEQLQSLSQQQHEQWVLLVSDDGSTDTTLDIVQEFSASHPQQVAVRRGGQRGVAENFLSLLKTPGLHAPYWAFCDQDDVWHADKLTHAVVWLEAQPEDVPALYCSRTRLIAASGSPSGCSPNWPRPPSFSNALVQNIASGNTMVFNEAARQLLARLEAAGVPFHDWLLYLVVTGRGGAVYFDRTPRVSYRQHATNYIGPWGSWRSQWQRLTIVLSGRYGAWVDANLDALHSIEADFNQDAREVLSRVRKFRKARGLRRPVLYRRSGAFHQSVAGNLALLAAAMFGRF